MTTAARDARIRRRAPGTPAAVGLIGDPHDGLHHRDMITEVPMPAYWVTRSRISDPVEYKKYTDLVPGIIARFGGKVLARGGRFQIMEGADKFHRFIVIEFST